MRFLELISARLHHHQPGIAAGFDVTRLRRSGTEARRSESRFDLARRANSERPVRDALLLRKSPVDGDQSFEVACHGIVKRVVELQDLRERRQEGMPPAVPGPRSRGSRGHWDLGRALYIQSENVVRIYRHPTVLWLLCVAMFYWITRIWLKLHRGEVFQDPVVWALEGRRQLRRRRRDRADRAVAWRPLHRSVNRLWLAFARVLASPRSRT